MSDSRNVKTAIGTVAIATGTLWYAVSWYLYRRRNNCPRLNGPTSVPGYYFVEGMLQSDNPILHNGVKYAKIVVKTSQTVQIVSDNLLTYSSSATSTSIQQYNAGQQLTINGIDVTEFIDQFPLVTIGENPQTNEYYYALPINQGCWRVSGWFNGTIMKKINSSRVSSELTDQVTSQPGSSLQAALCTVGVVMLLDSFMSE